MFVIVISMPLWYSSMLLVHKASISLSADRTSSEMLEISNV